MSGDGKESKPLPLERVLANTMSPNSPVKSQRVSLKGYVRDKQARMARTIADMKAVHGDKALPMIDKLSKRIELLNPIKDVEIARIAEALFL